MKRFFCAIDILLVIFLIAVQSWAADKEREAAELLAKAESLQNIRAEGAKPFHLHMRIHAERIVSAPVDGTYDEVWLGADKWRREIVFPGFNQIVIGYRDASWLTRNLDFRPRLAYLIDASIEEFIHPEALRPTEGMGGVHRKSKERVSIQCLQLRFSNSPSRELCFDPAGTLLSEEHQNQRFEYADFAKFDSKVFPRTIHIYEDRKEILNISADDLSQPQDIAPSQFAPVSGAVQMAPCDQSPTALVKKVPPHYPLEARQAHQQGDVILYAVLSGEGRVQRMKILQSAGATLDQATLEAVRQWEYAPVKCGAVPLPTEVEIRVNYELRD